MRHSESGRNVMTSLKTLLVVCGFIAFAVSPGLARENEDEHEGNGVSVAVPAPIAGVGIPLIAAAGGFLWLRRRRQQKADGAAN
jgi:hypothetical protein